MDNHQRKYWRLLIEPKGVLVDWLYVSRQRALLGEGSK